MTAPDREIARSPREQIARLMTDGRERTSNDIATFCGVPKVVAVRNLQVMVMRKQLSCERLVNSPTISAFKAVA